MNNSEHNHQNKIAAINDFSGFGRCSLAVALPIISHMKIQCCPVPTSIFSNHTGFPHFYFDDYQFILPDGTFINVDSPSRSGWIWVMADLNGAQNPPNRMGYDLFVFEFKDGELRTMGSSGTMYSNLEQYCSLTSSEALNGIACAHKAKTDTDYFKWVIKNVK